MASRDKSLDELFMLECLRLAGKGAGYVSPNPMVGAVIVQRTKVIGRGYHEKFGGAHAEVNAIRSAKQSVKGATLYVNLEPCNHFGKTPPCTDLIISSGIRNIIVGMKDPNPMVSGKGVAQLRHAGIDVHVGVLEEECKTFNEIFIKYISTGLPFVALKAAQTLDGKIADASGRSKWISNEKSRALVHKLRSTYDSVMIGAETVINDDPQLTVRAVRGRNPVRVIIDGRFKLPLASRIISNPLAAKTIIIISDKFAKAQNKKKEVILSRGVEVIELKGNKNGSISFKKILTTLGSLGIASVLVEGGATLYSSFTKEKLADKLLLFVSPRILGSGLDAFRHIPQKSIANAIRMEKCSVTNLDGDILIESYL
jgi:diaminohydroxyphosphoribosylaminopyrimidine deaminase/5-amino-6-(5-phosphoribosylamino)uracil reductase